MGNHRDRVRTSICCQSCGRVLAKLDDDGTIHIKPAKGPQVIAEASARLMFICEKVSYFTTENPNDERLKRSMTTPKKLDDGRLSFGIMCGKQTILERGVHYQHVAKPEAEDARVSA
ncbi:MAG: hypothetical protein MOGMAGMI_02004 [Candidatus Omnitrophica bacterium]|nr:hypothetical protein [Candidatus Omnitrophota bacterium]